MNAKEFSALAEQGYEGFWEKAALDAFPDIHWSQKWDKVYEADYPVFVNMLPKTRSGKIMRRVIKSVLTNKDLGDISTIEEEASVSEVKDAVLKMQRK